jgi:group I intron endonuclease
MAFIYVITNKINQKKYVGMTKRNPSVRFQEHIEVFQRGWEGNRPLYSAFEKYGVDNFSFTILEEVSSTEASQKEVYWISKFNTYGSSGYNATLGGNGCIIPRFNHQKIIKDYKKVGNQNEVARMNDCSYLSVNRILKKFNISTKTSEEVTGKKVAMIDTKTGETLKDFDSQADAARYLIDNGYSNIKKPKDLASSISKVIKGKRITCAGFKWARI